MPAPLTLVLLLLGFSLAVVAAATAAPFASWTWAKPPYRGQRDSKFGSSVTVSALHMAVGAPGIVWQKNHSHGAVYVYNILPSLTGSDMFTLHQVLLPPVANLLPPVSEKGGAAVPMGFGFRVAFFDDGNMLAVSAPEDVSCDPVVAPRNVSCPQRGSVYVYGRRAGNQFTLDAVIQDPRPIHGGFSGFGNSLAADLDLLAITASSESTCATGVFTALQDIPATQGCLNGAVWLFKANSTASPLSPERFTFVAFFKSAHTAAYQRFGASLSLHSDRLLVGAPADNSCQAGLVSPTIFASSTCSDSGAVHSFRVNPLIGGPWEAEVVIKPPPQNGTVSGEQFGGAVAHFNTLVAISHIYDDACFPGDWSEECPGTGSVRILSIDANDTWSFGQQLQPPEVVNRAKSDSRFGQSLTMSSTYGLAVTAPYSPRCVINSTTSQLSCRDGSPSILRVYTYAWNDSSFVTGPVFEIDKRSYYNVLASNGNFFALGVDDLPTCYFDESNDGCDAAGGVLALSPSRPIGPVGLALNPDPSLPNEYIWGYQSTASAAADFVIISAPYESGCDVASSPRGPTRFVGCRHSGGLFLFRRSLDPSGLPTFTPDAYIKQTQRGDTFLLGLSTAVSTDAGRIVAGTTYACSSPGVGCKRNNGILFVFDRSKDGSPGDGSAGAGAGSWSKTAEIQSGNVVGSDPDFGGSVAISGNGRTIVAGHSGDPSCATGVNPSLKNGTGCPRSGGFEIFVESDNGSWRSTAFIKPRVSVSRIFGFGARGTIAVSEDGRVVAVGLPHDPSCDPFDLGSGCPFRGAAFIYHCTGSCNSSSNSAWTLHTVLKPPPWASNPFSGLYFGQRVAISGQTLVVSAPAEQTNATGVNGDLYGPSVHSGAVFMYILNSSTDSWDLQFHFKVDLTGNLTDDAFVEAFGSSVDVWEASVTDDAVSSATALQTRLIVGSAYASGCYGMSFENTDHRPPLARPGRGEPCYGGLAFMYERFTNGTHSSWVITPLPNPVFDRVVQFESFGNTVGASGTVGVVFALSDAHCGTNFNDFDSMENSCFEAGAATMFASYGAISSATPGPPATPVLSSSDATAEADSTIVVIVVVVVVVVALIVIAAVVFVVRRRGQQSKGSSDNGKEMAEGHYAKFSQGTSTPGAYHNVNAISGAGDSTPGTTYHNVRNLSQQDAHATGQQYHNVKGAVGLPGSDGGAYGPLFPAQEW